MPTRQAPFRILAHAFVGMMLAGCAINATNDLTTERFLVAPGKFTLFNCQQIAIEADKNMKRQHDLEALMVRAGPSSAGQMVSTAVYRPEYLQLRGEMTDLRRTAVDKKCKVVPGDDKGGGTTSVNAIR
jgi:hypothetical protein